MKLDQLSDQSNLQLYRLLQGVDLPDFVKEAELDTEETISPLEKTAFADQDHKAYPINTPARIYVSNAFFQSKKASLEKKYGNNFVSGIEARIKQATEAFSIVNEINNYNVAAEKRATRDYEVIHVSTIEDDVLGNTDLFPVKTAEDFSASASVFANNMAKYPFEWREKIAKDFLAKSVDFGVDELPDVICKYAGMFYPDHTSSVANEIERRASKLTSKEAQEQMNKLAETVRGSEFESIDEVLKVAHIVYAIEFNDGAYTKPKVACLLPDPVDIFFTMSPTKVAEAINDVVEMAGEKYSVETLKKISADRYKEAFDLDIDPSNEMQLKEVLPTMPLSDVSLFKELTGLRPID